MPGGGIKIMYRMASFFATHARTKFLLKYLWILSGVKFKGREIRKGCIMDAPWRVSIEEGSFVNARCVFHTSNGNCEIKIGRNCDIAPEVMFMCTTHAVGDMNRRAGNLVHKSISIGDGCWIGTRAVILPGVSIGDGCVIAAGAVVTRSFPQNVLIAGCPANIKKRL